MTYLEIKRTLLEKTKELIERGSRVYICTSLVHSLNRMRVDSSQSSIHKALMFEAWMQCDKEVNEILGGLDVEDYIEVNKLDVDPKQFRLELLSKMIDELEK